MHTSKSKPTIPTLEIEGVEYSINWEKFRPGASVFIPCRNCMEAKKIIDPVMARRGVKPLYKIVAVEGIKGLRVWCEDLI